ncbi:uncharacterized protein MELLADRAFT_67642 [Melampsora larici-populina 98AG31]|uniref:Uncharacterized protein n=1 Tax=Melampsora larici-populina (strain 98AG31 / pathotype 3-4-7) TaxID=747676 RepID=F4S3X0_MELLP|nr:uncharacterized protein MELLADRAFT_67642 [Melampsora larici-populina 98AG31]EGG00666.1 hypothetical protein MELLADRAFT_67642 [Melampsora larici-populina 98AG31]
MPNNHSLPVEIVYQIISHYIDISSDSVINCKNIVHLAPMNHSLLSQLLKLRLVNSTWSLAVLPYAYNSIRFNSTSMISCFINNWKHSSIISTASRVRSLTFDQVDYPAFQSESALKSIGQASTSSRYLACLRYKFDQPVIPMTIVEEALHLCHDTLSDLKLNFDSPVSFTPQFIRIVERTPNLTALIIVGNTRGFQINHSESIRDLLNAATHLVSLSLHLIFLRPLNLKPASLPHLQHLSLTCNSYNSKAFVQLCQNHGNDIRCLEAFAHENRDHISKVVLSLQHSLEILFLESIPDLLPTDIQTEIFPKLKVIRTIDVIHTRSGLSWLNYEIFQNVHTFVASFWHSHDHYRAGLEAIEDRLLTKPITFKDIVFVMNNQEAKQGEDKSLSEMFKRHDVYCHFTSKCTFPDLIVSTSKRLD